MILVILLNLISLIGNLKFIHLYMKFFYLVYNLDFTKLLKVLIYFNYYNNIIIIKIYLHIFFLILIL